MARDSGTGTAELPTASPVVHAAAAMGLLLVALVLSVYKPRGFTVWAYAGQGRGSAACCTTLGPDWRVR